MSLFKQHILGKLLVAGLIGLSFSEATAQRSIGTYAVIFENNAGQTITMQMPGVSPWIGNLDWIIPVPPITGANSGFSYAGFAGSDMLVWLPAGLTYNNGTTTFNGGTNGAWVPKSPSALGFLSSGATAGGDLTGTYPNPSIANSAVTLSKLNPTGAVAGNVITYDGSNLVWQTPVTGATGAAGGDLTGTYPNPTIANNAITSASIQDGTILGIDIAPTAAIPYSKLSLNNSIQNSDLVFNSVTTSKVANGTVTTSKMADSAISGLKLLSKSVTYNHMSGLGAVAGNVLSFDGANVVWSAPASTSTTNATLTGNGTSGSPLGINLGNSNTWTANQTFGGTFLITANSRIAMTNSDNNARDLRFQEPSGTGSQYIGLRAPNLTNNGNYALPAVVGSVGQVMTISTSNGTDSASMAWTTVSATGTAGGDLTGSYPNPTIANNSITSAKIADGTIQGNDISSGTFATTNTHYALGNNDNVAREMRLLEPSGSGTNYTSFKAQAQSADITYTLPSTAPTAANQVLQVQSVSGSNASLAWGSGGGGGTMQYARTGVIASAGNTSYTVVSGDAIVGVDMSAGTNFTTNLPPATTAGQSLIVKIEKYNNGLLPVLTILPYGTDKIEGANNLAFGNAGGVRRIYSDGAGNWYTW